jgi:signal transduction histidine kinase
VRRWWHRRGLRARLTVVAATALAVGLGLSALAVAIGFAHSRVGQLDAAARAHARTLVALIDSDQLPTSLPVAPGELAQVIDARDRVVATSPGTSRTLPLLARNQLQHWQGGAAHTLSGGPANVGTARVVVLSARLRGQPVSAVVAEPLGDVRRTLTALGRVLVFAVPLLVLAFALICWALLGRALATVGALRRAAAAVGPTGAAQLPLPHSRDEIHALTVTLNAMLDRLAASAGRERAFVADAAHELRSPITSARTQLEVALAHPEISSWPEVAADAVRDLERLSSLVDDLLVLARLDAGGALERDEVDLVTVAGVLRPDEPMLVRGDRPALERLVRNLRDNAERHARGRVEVTVRRARDGRVELTVMDDGPGIPEPDREQVFERFTRLDTARSRDEGGSGLGLAIARATARAHGGDITVTDAPLGGAAFVVVLPPAH